MAVATAAASRDVEPQVRPSTLIKALNHPIRRSILRSLLKAAPASSRELRGGMLYISGNNLNFHLDILVTSGTATREKRTGYRESFYSPTEAIRAPWFQAALRLTADED